MKVNIGDFFYFDVDYEDDPSAFKNRPVLLLAEEEGNILLLISTTTTERNIPLRPHDHYKIPIQNWRKTGLREASWCRGKKLIRLPRTEVESLISADDYIGRMHPEEFNIIVEEVERLHG